MLASPRAGAASVIPTSLGSTSLRKAKLSLPTTSLSEMNTHILGVVCDDIGIPFVHEFQSRLGLAPFEVREPQDWCLNIAIGLGASEYLNPPGGAGIYRKESWSEHGIDLRFCQNWLSPYDQGGREWLGGLSIIDAAVEASRIRLRPILMTSFAFVLGVLPLAVATGAGAAARNSVGTAVAGGMLASTFLSVIFIPVLYVLLRTLVPGKVRGADDPEEHGDDDAPAIAAGHQELGDGANDQAEDDPTQNSHVPSLLLVGELIPARLPLVHAARTRAARGVSQPCTSDARRAHAVG